MHIFDALSTFTFTYKMMFITFTLYFFTFQVLFSLLPSRFFSSLLAWLSSPLPSLRSLSCSGRGANMEEPSRTREGGSCIQICFKYLQKYLFCFKYLQKYLFCFKYQQRYLLCFQITAKISAQASHCRLRPHHLRVSHLLPQGLPSPRSREGAEKSLCIFRNTNLSNCRRSNTPPFKFNKK